MATPEHNPQQTTYHGPHYVARDQHTPGKAPLHVTCHCGTIKIRAPPTRPPILECLCSICRRYGAIWAYYEVDEVTVESTDSVDGVDNVEGYVWGKGRLKFNRCKKCGCVTHYTVVKDTEPRVAVNVRMLERKEWEELEAEQSDGD